MTIHELIYQMQATDRGVNGITKIKTNLLSGKLCVSLEIRINFVKNINLEKQLFRAYSFAFDIIQDLLTTTHKLCKLRCQIF